jgi:hypothetical protein
LPVAGVYTFGGPRVGNAAFAKCYNGLKSEIRNPKSETNPKGEIGNGETGTLGERTWRVVFEEDGVCRVPGWLMGYRHVGQEVFIPTLGGMRMNPRLWFKVLSDLAGWMRHWSQGSVAPVADHPVGRYVEAVGRV